MPKDLFKGMILGSLSVLILAAFFWMHIEKPQEAQAQSCVGFTLASCLQPNCFNDPLEGFTPAPFCPGGASFYIPNSSDHTGYVGTDAMYTGFCYGN